MSQELRNYKLKIWRQENAKAKGKFACYEMKEVSPDTSFMEMLDLFNEHLILKGEEPVAFDHDCREGICGTCGLVINGYPHGHEASTTTCQLHMRKFKDNTTITIEPWRARAFPVVKDLVVDKSALDRIISKGGFISVKTGGTPDANAIPIRRADAEKAMDAAACIGCGACVAACKNASAMLFVGAKISQLAYLPQGKIERADRAKNMARQMKKEGFGNCTNEGECEAVCPKRISISNIAKMNREYMLSLLKE